MHSYCTPSWRINYDLQANLEMIVSMLSTPSDMTKIRWPLPYCLVWSTRNCTAHGECLALRISKKVNTFWPQWYMNVEIFVLKDKQMDKALPLYLHTG